MNESKPCACDESETHGKGDDLVSWFQGLEAKEERRLENEDFADEERKGYADFHGCFICDRIRRIRSFSSRKMNSKAEISGVARDCSVQNRFFLASRMLSGHSGKGFFRFAVPGNLGYIPIL
ncbi:unnamed protein product [Prunus armeniaca]|uniref:Uncharacterized protein n=1 Tax=Prunus armeniaca TaxID=36596 RepID=A0A6J5WX19_PRUAR|nr:unnamed protein product [Prunus armeniaca]